MVNVDSKLLEALQASTCFGIAYDSNIPECKQCDVEAQCKAKTQGEAVETPTEKPTKEKKKEVADLVAEVSGSKKSKKSGRPPGRIKSKDIKENIDKLLQGDMPVFKLMSLDELKALAAERNVEWKDYNNDNITRMRLIMVLKKSYE